MIGAAMRSTILPPAAAVVHVPERCRQWPRPLPEAAPDAFPSLLAQLPHEICCNHRLDIGREPSVSRVLDQVVMDEADGTSPMLDHARIYIEVCRHRPPQAVRWWIGKRSESPLAPRVNRVSADATVPGEHTVAHEVIEVALNRQIGR
jgi:hypothetical protein